MKKILSIVACSFIQQVCFAQPVINSISPLAALPLSSITISGSGFSAVADSNIVYFGPVTGEVLSATENSLTVKVPLGATYTFLSVTTGSLIGYSTQFFTPLTSAAGYPIDNSSFLSPFTITGNTAPNSQSLKVYDADGDGKTDILVIDTGSNSISFYRNATVANTVGMPSFATPVLKNIGATQYNGNNPFILADFDGDGQKDLAIDDTLIKLFKNNSIIGSIRFNDSTAVLPGKHFKDLAAGDIDGDGITDLASITYSGGTFNTDSIKIKIFQGAKNVGEKISFTSLPDFLTRPFKSYSTASSISLIDCNGDKKPDIFYKAWNYNTGEYNYDFFTAINTSTSGHISFVPLTITPVVSRVEQVRFADIDNDGLTDIITCNGNGKLISVLRNKSTLLNIVFDSAVNINVGRPLYDFEISDLDGDGKVDIAGISGDWEPWPGKKLAIIYKNLSTSGNFSFSAKAEYDLPGFPSSIAAGDFDGDGRQDLAIGLAFFSKGIVILKNNIGTPVKKSLCPSAAYYSLQSNTLGSTFQWQLSTDSINYINLIDSTIYSGIQTNKLIIKGTTSSMYGYRYRCITNGKLETPVELIFKNTWTGTADSKWENSVNWSCNTPPDGNIDVVILNGKVVLGSNASCRSISVSSPGTFEVLPGFTLTITH